MEFAPTGTTYAMSFNFYIATFFFDNGFPIKLFDSCLPCFCSDKFCDNSDVLRKTQQIYAVFPYFGHQSQKMQEELSSLFTKYFNDTQFNILLINNFQDWLFFSL